MSTGFMIAISAGVICGIIIAAYFVAIDQQAKTVPATNGAWPAIGPDVIAQAVRGHSPAAVFANACAGNGPAPQKLSRAGDPGNLTPAGFQAVRYALAAFFAIAGLTIGLVLRLPIPSLVLAPVFGALAALLGYMTPILWSSSASASAATRSKRSLAEATDLLTLVVESGMSLDEGLLSITERFHNALGDEIGKVLREIRLGRPRMAALETHGRVDRRGRPAPLGRVDRAVRPDGRPDRPSIARTGDRDAPAASGRPLRSARPRRRPGWSSRWWAASSRCSGSCSLARPSSRSSRACH